MFKRLFFVYAAQFLEALSSETGPLSSLSPGGTSFNIQNPIPYKSQKTGFFLKHAGQKSTKEELPEQRKASKRAVECQLKVQTHIWEHDVGCSSHLTPTRKSRRGNPRRDFFYGILPVQPRRHSSSPGKSRPHLTWPSPKTAVRAMRLVWSVL